MFDLVIHLCLACAVSFLYNFQLFSSSPMHFLLNWVLYGYYYRGNGSVFFYFSYFLWMSGCDYFNFFIFHQSSTDDTVWVWLCFSGRWPSFELYSNLGVFYLKVHVYGTFKKFKFLIACWLFGCFCCTFIVYAVQLKFRSQSITISGFISCR